MALSKQDLEARAKAIADGKTRYIRPSDGQEWVIRNLDNPRLSKRFGGQGGTDETAVMRKGNRGGGTEGARKQAEALTTPDPETRRLADQEMARMRTRGNVGHHGLPVSSLAAGEREKPGTIQAYERVHGKGQVGHTPGALVEMTPEAHDRLHHVEETKYYRSIKQAGQRSDKIFGSLGAIRFAAGRSARFVANRADAIQTGVDIFQQGQTGSEIDQAVQEPFAKVQDPFEASAKARARGGKTTVGTVTLPELGLSEFFMPPKQ